MSKLGLYLVFLIFIIVSCKDAGNRMEHNKHEDPLERLMKGNRRFLSGRPAHPDETRQRIRNLKKGQEPYVVIVSCSDSRVPPELVFDQGFGDVFSIRTAGNVIGEYELGSIEYAVEHLKCKLVMVMGHENCGAIEAYIKQGNEIHHDHIQSLIDYISGEIEEKELPDSLKHDLGHAVNANIRHGVKILQESEPILKELYAGKKIQIVGAFYDLDTGGVTLLK
jgi:carbonic anhydrase